VLVLIDIKVSAGIGKVERPHSLTPYFRSAVTTNR